MPKKQIRKTPLPAGKLPLVDLVNVAVQIMYAVTRDLTLAGSGCPPYPKGAKYARPLEASVASSLLSGLAALECRLTKTGDGAIVMTGGLPPGHNGSIHRFAESVGLSVYFPLKEKS